jgi:site-specific recombinase XerD
MNADICHDFVNHLRNRGYKGIKFFRNTVTRFTRWLASKNLTLSQVDPTVVNDYLRCRQKRGRQPATYFYPLRTFFRYAVRKGHITRDPTEGVYCVWVDRPGGFPAYQGVLRQILERPAFIRRYQLPLFAPDLELYVKHMLDLRYSKRHILGVLQYNYLFHRFLRRHRVKCLDHITPEHVDAFQRTRRRLLGHHRRLRPSFRLIHNTRGYIENFLSFAFERRGRHFRPPIITRESRAIPENLVQGYLHFCQTHKGHKPVTLHDQRKDLRHLGAFLDARGVEHIRDITIQDIDAYCLARANSYSVPMKPVAVLRSLLNYLYLQGIIPTDMARRVQSPCRFQADTRPKYLPWKKIQHLLASVDRRDAGGKRNYAILVLLACHGLRSREVAKLQMNDIDWKGDSFILRERKNGATTRLPLSVAAREALKGYLAVRPVCSFPEVFLTTYAPIKPLGKYLYVVAHRLTRKHLGCLLPQQGAYVLRHSYAKALLDRGASLSDIGALMGHRTLKGTSAYTRIATEDLREVTANYASLLMGADAP